MMKTYLQELFCALFLECKLYKIQHLHDHKQHFRDVLRDLLLISVTAKKTDVVLHVLQLTSCCLNSFSVPHLEWRQF